MSAPKRIQRKRTKGWRMPEGAVYVGRPSKWGNPFTVTNGHRQGWLVWDDRDRLGWVDYETSGGFMDSFQTQAEAVETSVATHSVWLRAIVRSKDEKDPLADIAELAGRDLACWCPLDQPCHADVLLEIANSDTYSPTYQCTRVDCNDVAVQGGLCAMHDKKEGR